MQAMNYSGLLIRAIQTQKHWPARCLQRGCPAPETGKNRRNPRAARWSPESYGMRLCAVGEALSTCCQKRSRFYQLLRGMRNPLRLRAKYKSIIVDIT